MKPTLPRRIGIIGAGFSGTALLAAISRLAHEPVEIILFEKTGQFALGEAYKTPYSFHLLNVRAKDMSAFEDEPAHFVQWLMARPDLQTYSDPHLPLAEQFMPRKLYGQYLTELLKHNQLNVIYETAEAVDVIPSATGVQAAIILADGRQCVVDQIVLAMGNPSPAAFPFPVEATHCITHSWDYTAPANIPSHDPVLIVGTGLSMIDTVLTLHHHGHQGPIYAVSRHGFLPLQHVDSSPAFQLQHENLSPTLSTLSRYISRQSRLLQKQGGDWRSVMNAVRPHVVALWQRINAQDKKRFVRHVLPYWNIHRHRVHRAIADLLTKLSDAQQLQIIAGRVTSATHNEVQIKPRGKNKTISLSASWLINCMGPSMHAAPQPLLAALLKRGLASIDASNLGLAMDGQGRLIDEKRQVSSLLFAIGPLRRAAEWETSAVPEIRKQCFDLAAYFFG